VEHKFQINLRGLIDLLSNHLYSGSEVFVRELLQNGVDAIRARTHLEPGFQGEVTIEVHQRPGKPPSLLFADNGIGLTEDEIHRFLATIGESSKRAQEGERPTDFIGQFGIGLLSCFVVSDEIVVVTRSAHGGSPPLEWRGRPDGTYGLKTLDADLAAGTHVYLTCKKGCEELFDADRVREMLCHYGILLPFPIRLNAGKVSEVVNTGGAPWRLKYASEKDRTKALIEYGRQTFNEDFFDAIPLRSVVGDLDGVAFVLAYEPSLASRRAHRVYLKNMLLTEHAENLLPEWAFFVKAVVNANDLRPTASRESFYEDDKLDAARTTLGNCLRDYLVGLSRRDPRKLEQLISLHALSIKSLAVQDDDFYRLFIDWLPFETSLGRMTLGEYRREHLTIRYVPDLDQFRQIARVASAQGLCVINGGFVHDAELLARCSDCLSDVQVEVVDATGLTHTFDELDLDEQDQVHGFLHVADNVLRPFKCAAEVKKFRPVELPALYSTGSEGRFLRAREQSREIADPLWSGVLDNLGRRGNTSGPHAQLCFNFTNPLVRRLVGLRDRQMLQRSIQMLYVQALLLGHHPLTAREMKLLNEGLLDFIDWGVAVQERQEEP
jgi:molecular chaperone HtpG